jgi:hypothetical protein
MHYRSKWQRRQPKCLNSGSGQAEPFEGVRLDMSRIHPECAATDPTDRSVPADILVRKEPDEEEDEEDEEDDSEKEGDDENEDDDEGYSE